jgi:formate dehydrogenase iron-sulfur subunit
VRGGLQAVERRAGGRAAAEWMSYDNTQQLDANSWRHVAFIEQSAPIVPSLSDFAGARLQRRDAPVDGRAAGSRGHGPADHRPRHARRGRARPAGQPRRATPRSAG